MVIKHLEYSKVTDLYVFSNIVHEIIVVKRVFLHFNLFKLCKLIANDEQ